MPDAAAVSRELALKLQAAHAQSHRLVGLLPDVPAQPFGDDFANPANGLPAP